MSIVSRTTVEPVSLGLVTDRFGSAAPSGDDRAVKDETLLRRVCRSLEAAGLSVVVVVAMDAGPGIQPNAHSLTRPRRALPSAGLSVVTGVGSADPSTGHPRDETASRFGFVGARAPRKATGAVGDADKAPVIVLTTAGDEEEARAAVAAGGFGYMVGVNELYVDRHPTTTPDVTSMDVEVLPPGVTDDRAGTPAAHSYGLTTREVEVLRAFANGSSTTEVAREFFVSPKTVKNHLAHAYAKLGVASRTQAVAKAVKMGIVTIG